MSGFVTTGLGLVPVIPHLTASEVLASGSRRPSLRSTEFSGIAEHRDFHVRFQSAVSLDERSFVDRGTNAADHSMASQSFTSLPGREDYFPYEALGACDHDFVPASSSIDALHLAEGRSLRYSEMRANRTRDRWLQSEIKSVHFEAIESLISQFENGNSVWGVKALMRHARSARHKGSGMNVIVKVPNGLVASDSGLYVGESAASDSKQIAAPSAGTIARTTTQPPPYGATTRTPRILQGAAPLAPSASGTLQSMSMAKSVGRSLSPPRCMEMTLSSKWHDDVLNKLGIWIGGWGRVGTPMLHSAPLSTRVRTLIGQLWDGVLLCNAASRSHPELVPRASIKMGQDASSSVSNLELFVSGCRRAGVKQAAEMGPQDMVCVMALCARDSRDSSSSSDKSANEQASHAPPRRGLVDALGSSAGPRGLTVHRCGDAKLSPSVSFGATASRVHADGSDAAAVERVLAVVESPYKRHRLEDAVDTLLWFLHGAVGMMAKYV